MTSRRSGNIPLIYSFHNTGHHARSWRHPSVDIGRLLDPQYYQQITEIAAEGLFDAAFLADFGVLRPDEKRLGPSPFEPHTLFSYLAARVPDIGLIGTVSTSVSDPYTVGRQIGTLDHLSGGRAGLNMVTSRGDDIARNHSQPALADHSSRYLRAGEFIDVLKALLLSWERDAVVGDKQAGRLTDDSRIRPVDRQGTYFQVEGALTVPRSPQGLPVFVQAGSSAAGIDFATREVDVVYARSLDLDRSREFYATVKAKAAAHGRDPDSVLVFVGLIAYSGRTDEEAHRFYDDVVATVHTDKALARLRDEFGVDLSGVDPDDPVPLAAFPDPATFDGSVTGLEEVLFVAKNHASSVGDLLNLLSSGTALGMQNVVGGPAIVADHIERWYDARAADGFFVLTPQTDIGLPAFVSGVVPELQRRGRYKTSYLAGETLRARLGLERY